MTTILWFSRHLSKKPCYKNVTFAAHSCSMSSSVLYWHCSYCSITIEQETSKFLGKTIQKGCRVMDYKSYHLLAIFKVADKMSLGTSSPLLRAVIRFFMHSLPIILRARAASRYCSDFHGWRYCNLINIVILLWGYNGWGIYYCTYPV